MGDSFVHLQVHERVLHARRRLSWVAGWPVLDNVRISQVPASVG